MPIPDRFGNNEASLGVSARDWHRHALEVRQKKKDMGNGFFPPNYDIVERTNTCICCGRVK